MRLERAKRGPRIFEAAELKMTLDKAGTPMKAMILLGINTGLGNTDIATLPSKAVDLKHGWLDFPRGKTGIGRRCPLWPETIVAIREAIDVRPKPKRQEHAGLLFITKYGQPWGTRSCTLPDAKGKVRKNADDPVCKEFTKLLVSLKIKRRVYPSIASAEALRRSAATAAIRWQLTPSWATHATIWRRCTASGSTTPGCWPSLSTSGSGFSENRKGSKINIAG